MREKGIAVLLGAGLAVAALAAPAGAAPRPSWDLKAATVSNPPASVAQGGSFAVKWKVTRSGARISAAKLRFLLSRDARKGRGDLALAPRVKLKGLGRRRSVRGRTRLTLPAAARSGSYRVLACLAQPRGRPDRRKRNDCRASHGALGVLATGGGPAGGGPAGGGGPGPGGGGPGPGGSAGGFPRQANPLDVSPSPDGSPVSEYVPVSGGELTATDSNGTTYTLTIPSDALFSGTTISMTPISSLGGMPGGLVGAVQLEPEGLVLNETATLEIEPLDPAPAPGRLAPFTAEGDGADFHLLPDPDGGLTVPVLHFSIPGVADMGSAETQQVQGQMPARTQAQYESLIRDAVKSGNTVAQIDLSAGYYRDIVRPALQAGLSSDAAMDHAFATGLSWQRQVTLLGLEAWVDAEIDEMLDLFQRMLRNAAERAYARCVADHDLSAVNRMLQIERWTQLLGLGSDSSYADVMQKIENCLRFELDFESALTLNVTGEVHGSFDYHLRSLDLVLSLSGPGSGISGSGALSWVEFDGMTVWDFVCHEGTEQEANGHAETIAQGTQDSTMRASLSVDLSPRLPGAPAVDAGEAARLELDTGGPLEFVRHVTTGGCGTQDTIASNTFWEVGFGLFDETVVKSQPLTVFTQLERGAPGAALILRKTISGGNLEEALTVDVWHRPLP
jgi:hypothetical protein